MDYSRKISERMWNQPDKGELEAEREQTFIDDIVQKSHIEKEIQRTDIFSGLLNNFRISFCCNPFQSPVFNLRYPRRAM